jgi:periplasmic protein TonB
MIAGSYAPEPRFRLGGAFLLALLLEAALIGGTGLYLGRSPSKAPRQVTAVQLELTQLPEPELPKPPEPEPPKPPKPPEVTPKPPVAAPKPVVHQAPPPVHPVQPPLPKPIGPVSDVPSDFATPESVPPPPPPPPTPATAGAIKATPAELLAAELRAAVQATVQYPASARMLGLTGSIKLGFDYQSGRIFNVRVVQSSGRDMLDTAALGALNSAAIPPPPKEIGDQLVNFVITVDLPTRH